ncbi:thioesterase family protein [Mycobacteroides abscessus]|uniref:thioesterase family protein n=1 Tax=Mycobacteroides abscessus TaxID=36809 RepID=UPI000940F828|nr:thioesterase family protein [Mycobacteroides abscessus]
MVDAPFAQAMSLTPAGEGLFDAHLNDTWTIGPKLHGGVMLALLAGAARESLTEGLRTSGSSAGQREPIAVSASYLFAPSPGDMQVRTSVRKHGKQISLVDAELIQGDRTAVHAVVTLGTPERHVGPLLTALPPALTQLPAEPPPGVAPIAEGHPMGEIFHLFGGLDVRPSLRSMSDLSERGKPEIVLWARPRDMAPDGLFALVCGDISVPVTFPLGRFGWAPTVQLTTYLRTLPADGWLRVLCSTNQIGQHWFDSEHTVIDSEGALVVQSRQLAMVPVN